MSDMRRAPPARPVSAAPDQGNRDHVARNRAAGNLNHDNQRLADYGRSAQEARRQRHLRPYRLPARIDAQAPRQAISVTKPPMDKRRVGRPRTRLGEGPGDYVGFRAPPELKARLAAAAAATGRSLSTETQFRLEQSFRDDQLLAALAELREEIHRNTKPRRNHGQ